MYTNYGKNQTGTEGAKLNALQDNYAGNGTSVQPGGDYADSCRIGTYTNCWQYPTDRWITVLVHVVPGHHNGDSNAADMSSTSNRRDAGIEVWVADYGATTYTKIWEKFDYVWNYDATTSYGNAYGFNALSLSQYMNGALAGVGWWRRYTQVIFSTSFIECPKVYA